MLNNLKEWISDQWFWHKVRLLIIGATALAAVAALVAVPIFTSQTPGELSAQPSRTTEPSVSASNSALQDCTEVLSSVSAGEGLAKLKEQTANVDASCLKGENYKQALLEAMGSNRPTKEPSKPSDGCPALSAAALAQVNAKPNLREMAPEVVTNVDNYITIIQRSCARADGQNLAAQIAAALSA